MRSYWKIKLWAKFVNHFDVFDNLRSRKTQCDRSNNGNTTGNVTYIDHVTHNGTVSTSNYMVCRAITD